MCAWDETETALVDMIHKKFPGSKVTHSIRWLERNNNHRRGSKGGGCAGARPSPLFFP